jgi:hypothetical protein
MMAALSAVVMYDTCEVKVIHESSYANCIIPGCDYGYSLVEISEEPAAYIFNTIKNRETREKFKKEGNVRKAQRGPR